MNLQTLYDLSEQTGDLGDEAEFTIYHVEPKWYGYNAHSTIEAAEEDLANLTKYNERVRREQPTKEIKPRRLIKTTFKITREILDTVEFPIEKEKK